MQQSTKYIISIAVMSVGIITILIATFVEMYLSENNYAATTEAAIESKWEDNQHIFSNYKQQVIETAHIPSIYSDDLTKVMSGTFTARASEQNRTVVQWLKESNISIDDNIYRNLHQITEAGRHEFQNVQIARLNICKQYTEVQKSTVRGLMIRLAGYPKLDSKKCATLTVNRYGNTVITLK